MNPTSLNAPAVHKPTLLTAVIAIVVVIVIYHLVFGRKR